MSRRRSPQFQHLNRNQALTQPHTRQHNLHLSKGTPQQHNSRQQATLSKTRPTRQHRQACSTYTQQRRVLLQPVQLRKRMLLTKSPTKKQQGPIKVLRHTRTKQTQSSRTLQPLTYRHNANHGRRPHTTYLQRRRQQQDNAMSQFKQCKRTRILGQ